MKPVAMAFNKFTCDIGKKNSYLYQSVCKLQKWWMQKYPDNSTVSRDNSIKILGKCTCSKQTMASF
jgi:hypothetical protein